MEIRQLRHFIAVVDTLNFRRAAELVNLTQQAVSKSIIQLESQIGLKLLDRDRQSVRLTSFGETLLPYARSVIAEAQRFDDVLGDIVGRKFGQLKIGATPTLLDDIVPTTLGIFCAKYPRIRVAIERGDFARLRDLLLQGELDILLSTSPDETPNHLIAMTQISRDQNVIVVHSGHPLADGAMVDWRRLSDFPRIAMQNYSKAETYLAALFADSGQPVPQPGIKTSSTMFAISWVQQGEAWWIVPRRLVSRALRDGSLKELVTPLQDNSWPLIIATRRHAARSPAASAYAQIVTAHTGQGEADK